MPKIAVVLSGCGVYDGSEIHETAAAMAALTRGGAEVIFINVECFALLCIALLCIALLCIALHCIGI